MKVLWAYILLLRPIQWLKNLMLLFPPFLGGGILIEGMASRSVMPLIAFCAASSANYVFNDLLDCSADLHHPKKSKRPLPSGMVSANGAVYMALVLGVASLAAAYTVSFRFLLLLVLYFCISLLYSLSFKNIPLLDIFCISAGFLVRLVAGGEAFCILLSEWLFLSVFLLSMFLSTGKRLGEKQSLGENAGRHRSALNGYPEGFLQGAMYMTGSAVLVTYSMYVLSKHSTVLLYTVPLCCFGLMRYIMRVQSGRSGDPTESLVRDVPLLIVGVVWACMVGWGVYGR